MNCTTDDVREVLMKGKSGDCNPVYVIVTRKLPGQNKYADYRVRVSSVEYEDGNLVFRT